MTGYLLSGSDDQNICVWDINQTNQNVVTQEPVVKIENAHDSIVEDVTWNKFDINMFTTVGDDKKLSCWDLRTPQRPTISVEGHQAEIMSINTSHYSEFIMATGSADKTIGVWDIRSVKTKLYCFKGHKDVVTNVRFSKTQKNFLASSSHDRNINVWDLTKTGQYQTDQ